MKKEDQVTQVKLPISKHHKMSFVDYEVVGFFLWLSFSCILSYNEKDSGPNQFFGGRDFSLHNTLAKRRVRKGRMKTKAKVIDDTLPIWNPCPGKEPQQVHLP